MKIISSNQDQTKKIAAKLARSIHHPAIIGLIGDLGAGKTVFAQGFAAGLGLDPKKIQSPTFVLHRQYQLPAGPLSTFNHLDLYRLSPEDIEESDLNEIINDPSAVSLVEWFDRGQKLLDPSFPLFQVRFKNIDHQKRQLTFSFPKDFQSPSFQEFLA